jgi:AcrR family transcriptional regulator
MAIADGEGLDAVSMRRIAAELGVGTMTLYYYVRTKDELLALMDDAIMGELVVPDDELPEGWREGLAEIARRTFAAQARHPYARELHPTTQSGPNSIRHLEQSLAVAAHTGLDSGTQLEIIMLVDDYVFGYAVRSGRQRAADDGVGPELDAVFEYLEAQLESGDYPHLRAVVGDEPRAAMVRLAQQAMDDGRFERGLQRLLDGIELDVERRKANALPAR